MRSPVHEDERKALLTSREALKPDSYFFVKYRLTPAEGLSLEEAAARVSIVSTLRTMRRLTYEAVRARIQNAGLITSLDNSGYVEVAFPLAQCSEREGLTHLLLLITAGAEYNYTRTFWIESLELPENFVRRYKGPRFGKSGIQDVFKASSRPILGLVIKPRTGVGLNQILNVCDEALRGGADFIVDDLLLIDPDGELSFENRVKPFVALAKSVSNATKQEKKYFVNVGIASHKAAEYALSGVASGVGAVLVNAFTMGIGGVEHVVESLNGAVPVIATNMGSGIMTRGSLLGSAAVFPTGMSEAVVAKLSRIAGADAAHTGTSASECYGEDAWGPPARALLHQLFDLRPAMPVAEGDLTVANFWHNVRSLGRDILVEPTSGIVDFPGGPRKGAAAFRQLAESLDPEMDAETADKTIRQIAKKHSFSEALTFFGYNPREWSKT